MYTCREIPEVTPCRRVRGRRALSPLDLKCTTRCNVVMPSRGSTKCRQIPVTKVCPPVRGRVRCLPRDSAIECVTDCKVRPSKRRIRCRPPPGTKTCRLVREETQCLPSSSTSGCTTTCSVVRSYQGSSMRRRVPISKTCRFVREEECLSSSSPSDCIPTCKVVKSCRVVKEVQCLSSTSTSECTTSGSSSECTTTYSVVGPCEGTTEYWKVPRTKRRRVRGKARRLPAPPPVECITTCEVAKPRLVPKCRKTPVTKTWELVKEKVDCVPGTSTSECTTTCNVVRSYQETTKCQETPGSDGVECPLSASTLECTTRSNVVKPCPGNLKQLIVTKRKISAHGPCVYEHRKYVCERPKKVCVPKRIIKRTCVEPPVCQPPFPAIISVEKCCVPKPFLKLICDSGKRTLIPETTKFLCGMNLFNGIWVISICQAVYGTFTVIFGMLRLFVNVVKGKFDHQAISVYIGNVWRVIIGLFLIVCGCILMRGIYWCDPVYFEIASMILRIFAAVGFAISVGRLVFFGFGYDHISAVEFFILYVINLYFLVVVENYRMCNQDILC